MIRIRTIVCVVISSVAVSLFICSCPQKLRHITAQRPSLSKAVMLPSKWPIKELTLPPGATSGELPLHLTGEQSASSVGPIDIIVYDDKEKESIIGQSWSVAFTSSLTLEQLNKYVIDCISRSDISILRQEESSNENDTISRQFTIYYLSDLYELEVGREIRTAIRPHDSYYYSIEKRNLMNSRYK